MGGSLRTLAGLLRDDGRLMLVLSDQRPAMLEALVMAACEARLGITSLVQQGADYRLELAPSLLQAAAVPGADLETEIQETAVEAAVDTIRVRGEPTAWRTLHAAIQQRLAREGLYTRALAAEEGAPSPVALVAEQVQLGLGAPGPLRLLEGDRARDLWWLVDPADVAEPLCDRVELAAFEILQAAPALGEADFGAALCGRFPGPLTPEADLMRACLRAYGRQAVPGRWQLRDEDQADVRQAERRKIVDNLLALGERLGYQTGSRAPFDLAWRAAGQVRAVFVVRWQAVVGEVLALSAQAGGAHPYLVIPGGRAALVSYKRAHNPLWQEVVAEAGWRFVKYRHVRRLAGQPDIDEYTLRTIVGLDPIVEQERAQIPLF